MPDRIDPTSGETEAMPGPRLRQLAEDLKVERQALVLAQKRADLAAAWAQRLAWLITEFIHSTGRVSEGGLREAVRQARAAGFEAEAAEARDRRGERP